MQLNLRRKIFFSLITLLLIFAMIVVMGEIVVRYFNLGNRNPIFLYNNQIPKRLPHYQFINFKENVNTVFFNNHGFHDLDREPKSNKYRYAFIGDSMVEGLEVPRDSLFTNHLNRYFEKYKINAEVLNFGTSGSGTTYQYKLWDTYIKTKFEINHLVLCFYLGNDLENNSLYLGGPKENFSYFIDSTGTILLYGKERGFFRKCITRLNNYSAFANTIYQRLYLLKRKFLKNKQRIEIDNKIDNFENKLDYKAWSETVMGTINLINKWTAELNSEGIKLSIILIHPFEYYEDEDHYYSLNKLNFQKNLKKLCTLNNVDILQIKYKENYKQYFWPHWKHANLFGHYNYLGHREVANQIYKLLNNSSR